MFACDFATFAYSLTEVISGREISWKDLRLKLKIKRELTYFAKLGNIKMSRINFRLSFRHTS